MDKGLIGGETLFTDLPHLKANANKNKYRNELQAVCTSTYLNMLNEDIAAQRIAEGKKPLAPSTTKSKHKDTKVSTPTLKGAL